MNKNYEGLLKIKKQSTYESIKGKYDNNTTIYPD